MNNRKIIVYPKSAMKPIILTDISDTSLEDLKKNISEVLSNKNISILETGTDCLIARPSEIQAVLISEKADIENSIYAKELKNDNNSD